MVGSHDLTSQGSFHENIGESIKYREKQKQDASQNEAAEAKRKVCEEHTIIFLEQILFVETAAFTFGEVLGSDRGKLIKLSGCSLIRFLLKSTRF